MQTQLSHFLCSDFLTLLSFQMYLELSITKNINLEMIFQMIYKNGISQ